MKVNLQKEKILGVEICSESKAKVLEFIEKSIKKDHEKLFIVTPNPEILVIAHEDPRYKRVLNEANIALPDGVGVILASFHQDGRITRKISGVDFVQMLAKMASDHNGKHPKNPINTGFLGGYDGVAEKSAECLQKIYKNLAVSYVAEEYDRENLQKSNTDILFVAFGSPKQELWIADHLKELDVKVVVGVGGSFDMISGKVRRAPYLVRFIGFEWLYRLIRQPWRIRRQMKLVKFIWLVIKD